MSKNVKSNVVVVAANQFIMMNKVAAHVVNLFLVKQSDY